MENTTYFESNLVGRRTRYPLARDCIGEIVLVTLDPPALKDNLIVPVVTVAWSDGRIVSHIELSKLDVEMSFGQFDEETPKD